MRVYMKKMQIRLLHLDPMYNMGSRQFGDMRMGIPQVQATGIMQQAPQGIFYALPMVQEGGNDDDFFWSC